MLMSNTGLGLIIQDEGGILPDQTQNQASGLDASQSLHHTQVGH